jgi:hypothetical protein
VRGMTKTVRRTKSGKGAVITVRKSGSATAARQEGRRARIAAEAGRQLQFTPGQMIALRRATAR